MACILCSYFEGIYDRCRYLPTLSVTQTDGVWAQRPYCPLAIVTDDAHSYAEHLSLWRHLFPAIHPMLQRNQRRYHVKMKCTLLGEWSTFSPVSLPEIPYLSLNPMDHNTPKFSPNQSIMKGTLLEEHSSFSTANHLPFRGLYWNSIILHSVLMPTTFERLVSVRQWWRTKYLLRWISSSSQEVCLKINIQHWPTNLVSWVTISVQWRALYLTRS
jgi:hypothetical protein